MRKFDTALNEHEKQSEGIDSHKEIVSPRSEKEEG